MLRCCSIFVSFAFVLMFFGACSKSSQSGKEQTLTVAISQEPQSFDPLQAETGATLFVVKQLTSTLLSAKSDGSVILQDAESFSWRSAGHELEFRTKPFLKYSNGQAVKACDYREAILRALAPDTRGPFSDLLFDLRGYDSRWTQLEFEKNKNQIGVECQNENHFLKLKLKTKFSRKVLYAFTFPISSPLHAEYPSVVSGGFRLKSYEVGVAINLERNRFHESFIHSLNLLYAKLFIVKDSFAARTLFQKGEVDVLDEIPVQVVESHQKNNTLKTFPFVATYMLGFGFSGGALDLETRKSLSLAVRELEVNQLLITGEKKSLGWVPPSLSVGPIQDKAIKLWNDSETGALPSVTNKKATKKKVSLYFNPSERNTLLAERISRLVYERSNVALRLEPTEWKVLLSTLKSNPPPLYRFAWTAVYPDPLFFLEIFLSDNPNNYGRWKNAEYDRIVKKLLSWPSYERSDDFWELFEKAHRILVVEDPALVPVYSYVKNFLVAPRVLKWNADFRGICDLSVVDIQNK